MALGTITVPASLDNPGGPTPVQVDNISFLGDDAYAAGGTADFQALFRAVTKNNREVLAVIGGDCGGYVPVYDKANDKLKVYEQTNVATSPLIETATSDLSGTTFNLTVLSK
jgi:hypothetical protein